MENGHLGLRGHLAVLIASNSEEESVPILHQSMVEDTALEKTLIAKTVLEEHANVSLKMNQITWHL
jgi:hypothetical protein